MGLILAQKLSVVKTVYPDEEEDGGDERKAGESQHQESDANTKDISKPFSEEDNHFHAVNDS